MKAGEEFFLRFLEGHDKQFIIPVYQRNYDWKKEQCEQLFNDILDIVLLNQKSYFIGSIVSIFDEDSSKDGEYVIIDGQQRITTLSILLLAIFNLLENEMVVSSSDTLKEQIKDTYLVNKYSEDKKRIRLKPIKDDNQAFLKLFENCQESYSRNSNITVNYLYLTEKIKDVANQGTTVDEFFNAIKKLVIVDIRLKRGEDNPQLIFESLNSTGKQLEEADLIRNFILMDKEPIVQEKFYEKYWHPIEKNTGYRVSEFIRDYLTYKSGKTPRKDKIYVEFKLFVNEQCKGEKELEALLEDLFIFSKFYHQFLFFNTKNEKINFTLKQISRLQVGVSYPYLLDIFHAWSENIINENEVQKILAYIESFVFRRLICTAPTNSLNKIFATLGKNIRRLNNHETEYFEIFKHLITAGTSNSRYPNNGEFLEELKSRDVYHLKAKNRIHLFERIENHNNREKVDVEGMIEAKDGGLTFEHIMPQSLTSKWKENLGTSQYALIHEKYLHTLGNITLTAYNSELSNKPFVDKLNKTNGFNESKLWLNKTLQNLTTWGEEEISKRATLLANRAIEIWSFPKSNYQPKQKIETQLSIYDNFNFTNTKPRNFTFIEEKHQVGSWRELYKKITKILYDLDPVTFEKLVSETDSGLYMASTSQDMRTSWKLEDNIFLEVNLSTEGVIGRLKHLFEEFNLEGDDLTITLK